ncbi:MAG: hypothetical protein LBC03_03550 [Nitrososphaerota archaeon]|nr:hypothetical protein [Nitrososphaerota archaeon]
MHKPKNCPNPKEIYKSQEPQKICLKHYQFGIDIIVKIGHLYYNKHQTIQQIKQTLKKLGSCLKIVDKKNC